MSPRARRPRKRAQFVWLPKGTSPQARLAAALALSSPTRMTKPRTPKPRRAAARRMPVSPFIDLVGPSSSAPVAPVGATGGAPVQLQTEDNIKIVKRVSARLDDFFQSGSFISSDEEDNMEVNSAGPTKKEPVGSLVMLDDSDDDVLVTGPVDTSGPSTSAMALSPPETEEDIMVLVDTILMTPNTTGTATETEAIYPDHSLVTPAAEESDNAGGLASNISKAPSGTAKKPINDIKSLEEYRRTTEEMLQSASSLLEEFRGNKKAPAKEEKVAKQPKNDSDEKIIKVTACPVCMENLADRPAAVTLCGHIFCKECITMTARTIKKCPNCRKPVTLKKIHPIYF